jgi:hypothetical protein
LGVKNSVADLGCLSQIMDHDFYPSRIPDPKTATKERGETKFVVIRFYNYKIHKIENYLIFEMLKENFFVNFQRIIVFFTQKVVIKLSKIWIWDPRSGFWDPEKTYLGSWI